MGLMASKEYYQGFAAEIWRGGFQIGTGRLEDKGQFPSLIFRLEE